MRWTSCVVLSCLLPAVVLAGSWPQFHGPNGSGLADSDHPLPTQIGPSDNVLWKVPLPPGHSSPAVHGDRLYLTAAKGQTLLTLGLDRHTGKLLWQAEAPCKELEKVHQIGNLAQPSPATDGDHVVSFFGSAGLFCYDSQGKLLWHQSFPPFKNDFGAGSSPILAGDRVLLSQDHDTDSFLMAFDKRTGRVLWKADRSEFPRGYATPVVWEVESRKQVVVPGTLRAVAYDFETGKEVWTVRGLARICNMTPVVGADGILYLAAWAPGADAEDKEGMAPFAQALREDKNGNGMLEPDEVTEDSVKRRFTQIDRDKDGHITRDEYENMRHIFDEARNVVMAIKPGGRGDITQTHVLWTQHRMLPYVPSPLYCKGLLFLVKTGGLLACLDARTGQPTKHERVFGTSGYYASPVAGDGKVYTVSQRGELSVVTAEPQWRLLHRARFEEDVFATPAIVNGRIYLRTAGHLYCFGALAGPLKP
jgi:outer membrane protein assembly factor BamB